MKSIRLQRRRHQRGSAQRSFIIEHLEQRSLMDSYGLADSWTPIGPTSASVFALERDPSVDSRMYAGMFFGGLYRSDDASLSWKHVPSPFSTKTVFSVAVDPTDSNILFVGTFEAGLFRSRDAGAHWTHLDQGLFDASIQDIAIDPIHPEQLLVASESGVFRSVDQGESWTLASQGLDFNGKSLLFDPVEPNLVWAGSLDRGVFRSRDAGATWQSFSPGLQDLAINSVGYDDTCGGIYLAASHSVYRLGPGSGSTWQNVTFNLPNTTMYQIVPRPQNSALLLATDAGVFQYNSCNDNIWNPWAPIPARIISTNQTGEFVHVVSTNGRLLATLDEGTNPFFPTENGMQTLFAGTLATSALGGVSTVYAGTDRGLYYTSPTFPHDDQGVWQWAPGFGLSDGIFGVTPHPTQLGTLYAGTEFRGVWKTTDFGSSWTQSSDGITPSLITSITQARSGNRTLYAGTGQSGLFLSRDNGATWQRGALQVVTSPQITAVYADPFDANVAYFGTLQGELFRTRDDGATFQRMFGGSFSSGVVGFFHFESGPLLAVTASGQVMSSSDNGTTWNAALGDIPVPVLQINGDPLNPKRAFASTSGGGIYRTIDGGLSWQAVNTGLSVPFVFATAVDPTNSQVVYAATLNQVFRSTNGGSTWANLSQGLPAGVIPQIQFRNGTVYVSVRDNGIFALSPGANTWQPMAVDPPFRGNIPLWGSTWDDQTLFAGTDRRGIFRSVNAGLTWDASSHGMSLFVRTIAIDVNNVNILYAGTFGGGIFKTTDGGLHWTPMGLADRNIFKVAIDPHNSNRIFAASTVGIARSEDGGQTWTDLGQRTTFVLDIVASTTSPGRLLLSGFNGSTVHNGIIQSLDGGQTWERTSNGLPDVNITSVVLLPGSGRILASAESRGTYYSDDSGKTWIPSDNHLIGGAIINKLVAPAQGSVVYAASRGYGVFRSLDQGLTWEPSFGLTGDVPSIEMDPSLPTRVYAATAQGIYVSSNQGQLWQPLSPGLGNTALKAIAVSPQNPQRLYAASNSTAYRSEDMGLTWTVLTAQLPPLILNSLFIDPQSPNVILLGTQGNGIYRSENDGQSWTAATMDATQLNVIRFAVEPNGDIHAATASNGVIVSHDQGRTWSGAVNELLVDPVALYLAVDPVNVGTIYATTSGGGVIKSTDGGNNWRLANQGLTNLFSLALAIDDTNPQVLYVGTAGSGVFTTANGGQTWQPLNTGLFNTNVTALAIDRVDHQIVYAGTEGGSVFAIHRGLVDTDGDGVIDSRDVAPQDPAIAYSQLYFRDQDGDGFGDFGTPIFANTLSPPVGYVEWGNDTNDGNAQVVPGVVPQRNRALGIDLLGLAESGELPISQLSEIPVTAAPVRLTWQGLESQPGVLSGPDWDLLRASRDFYRAHGIAMSLTVSPLASGFATLPADLRDPLLQGSITFSDPAVIARFNHLLDVLHTELSGVNLVSLQIGHEVDAFAQVTVDSAFWQGYATFFRATKAHAESLWGTSLPVGITWTSDGYTGSFLDSLRLLLDPLTDMTSLTFAPRSDSFAAVSPLLISPLLQQIVNRSYPKPIYFQSVVFPSAPATESSSVYQSQFLRAFFDFWDAAADSVPFAAFGTLHDLSTEKAERAGEVLYPNTASDSIAIRTRYFASLGLRTYSGGGHDKAIYATLRQLLQERQWLQDPGSAAVPSGVAWQPIGPENALIFALERDPFDAGTMYAGTYFGGLYRSLNGGFTWTPLTTPFAQRVVFDIATDPHHPGTLYVATFQDGIYRTNDAGQTWNHISNGLTDLDVQDIEVDPFNADHLLAATFAGVFRSDNGGATWSLTSGIAGSVPAKSITFDPHEQYVVYVGTLDQRGVLRSTDGGNSWTPFNTGLAVNDVQRLRFDTRSGDILYATSSGGNLYRWQRWTGLWESIANGLPNGPISDVTTNPLRSDDIYVATGAGVYRSINGGTTWAPIYVASGSDGLTISFRISISPTGSVIHIGNLNGTGLVASTDGGVTWSSATTGIQNLFVGAMAVPQANNASLILAGSDRGISFTSPSFWNNGVPQWFNAAFPQTIFELEPDPLHPGTVLSGTERRGVWRSTDLGVTWNPSATGILPRHTNAIAQSHLSTATLFAGTSSGLWISRDSGSTWNPAESLSIPAITAIAEDTHRPGTWLFGSNLSDLYRSPDNGFSLISAKGGLPGGTVTSLAYGADSKAYAVIDSGNVYVSANDGDQWTLLRTSVTGTIQKLVPHPSNGSRLLLATRTGGVLLSSDGGQTWQSAAGSMATADIGDIEFDPANSQSAFATANGTVYRSNDGGLTWSANTTGLPSVPLRDVLVDRTNNSRVWVFAEGRGLYRSTDGGATWSLATSAWSSSQNVPLLQDIANSARFLAGPNHSGVLQSSDGGTSWSSLGTGISLFVRAIEFDRHQDGVVYAGSLNDGLFRSQDGGTTWQALPLASGTLFDLELDPFNSNVLYLATAAGVVTSLDAGATFSAPHGPLNTTSTDGFVLSLEVNPNDGTIYAATGGAGLWRSSDHGLTWQAINAGITANQFLSLLLDPASPQTLYAGSVGAGVFVTEDGGSHWRTLNDGLFNKTVTSLAMDPTNHNLIYAGTEGGGAFQLNRVPTDSVQVAGSVVSASIQSDAIEFQLENTFRAQIQFYGEDIVRVRVSPTGVFSTFRTGAIVATPRSLGDIITGLEDSPYQTTIRTAHVTVIVHKSPFHVELLRADGTPISQDLPGGVQWHSGTGRIELQRAAPVDEDYFGLGMRGGPLSRRGDVLVMRNTDRGAYQEFTNPLYSSTPFYLGERSGSFFGVFFDNPAQSYFDLDSAHDGIVRMGAESGEIDYYVMPGSSAQRVMQSYSSLTGPAPLPAAWTLGYQQSRYGYTSFAEILQIAQAFRDYHIPADALYFDLDYMQGLNLFSWDPIHFPNPQANNALLHQLGFHTVNIVDPTVQPDDPLYATLANQQLFVRNSDGTTLLNPIFDPWGFVSWLDFSDPDTANWYRNALVQFLGTGVSGVWNDLNEPAQNNMPEAVYDFNGRKLSDEEARNLYALTEVALTQEALLQAHPNERPFILSRSGYAGIQRYAANWSGDTLSTFDSLRVSIQTSLQMAMSGQIYFGHDIGGFFDSPSPELFTRWLEFSSFTPFFRNHALNTTDPREPWQFGEPYTSLARNIINQRYQLLPYLYSEAEEASRTGDPILSPLFFQYPDDPQVYHEDDEFLWGDSMLVAPVHEAGVTRATVYLPQGNRWFDWNTGLGYDPGTVTVDAPLGTIPVFVREGSIIPTSVVKQHVGESVDPRLYLDVFPGDKPGSFELYEDDGISFDYKSNQYLRTQITSTTTDAIRTLTVHRGTGSYSAPQRDLFVRFRNISNDRLIVTLGNGKLARVASEDALEQVQSGWSYDASTRVLTVRFAQPTADANVTVTQLDLGAWLAHLAAEGNLPTSPADLPDRWVAQGPTTGVPFSLARDPFDHSHLLAGTFFGGIYQSTNNGVTWSAVSTPFGERSVFDVEFDPGNRGVYFVATFEQGLYRTPDGGQTWLTSNRGLTDLNIQDVAIDPNDSRVVLVATFTGVFKSVDGGQSWRLSSGNNPLSPKHIAFDPVHADVVYVATLTGTGVYRSTAQGDAWEPYAAGLNGNDAQRLYLDNQGNAYVVSSGGQAFRLDRTSNTWNLISHDLPTVPFNDLVTLPSDPQRLLLATDAGLYISPNAGIDWFLALGSSNYFQQSSLRLLVDPVAGRIHVANLHGTGLVYSDDGGQTWLPSISGFQNLFVGALEIVNTANTSVIYAGSDKGLYYTSEALRSPDGLPWTAPGTGQSLDLGIFKLVAPEDQPGTIFAGTERRGVWRSTDWGQTWSARNQGILPLQVYGLVQLASSPDILIAGTSAGLWISRDHGVHWNETDLTIPAVTAVLVDPFSESTIFVGTDQGKVYRSTNSGTTFVLTDGGLPSDQIEQLVASSNGRLYAITDQGDLYVSDNRGTQWSLLRSFVNGIATVIRMDPQSPLTLYLGTRDHGILKSTDGGATWQSSNGNLPLLPIASLEITDSGRIYLGSLGAFATSSDHGQSWTLSTNSLLQGTVYQVLVDRQDEHHIWLSLEDHPMIQSFNGGLTWSTATVDLPSDGEVPVWQDWSDPTRLWAGVRAGGVYTSDSSGAHWVPQTDGISLFVRALAIDPQNSQIMYAGSLKDGVFKTVDGGAHWTNTGLIGVLVFDIAIDPHDSKVVYLATGSGVMMSLDRGSTWNLTNGPYLSGTAFPLAVLALQVDPVIPRIYAVTQNGAFRSDDQGHQWTPISQDLVATAYLSVAIDPHNHNTVYLGSVSHGVFASDDGGDHWVQLSDGLFNKTITSLQVDPGDSKVLWVGTEGGGVFRLERTAVPGLPESRSFRMGFTTLPSAYSEAALNDVYQVIRDNADLVAHNQQEGVPWLEALQSSNYLDYSQHLQTRWQTDLAKDQQYAASHAKYLMLNPIDTSYEGLAPYWGTDVRSNLPAPFNQYTFDHPDVQKAFTNYVIAAIEFWHPTYLAIGIEANILLAKRPDLWEGYKSLNQHVYNTIKALYPQLTVFTTIQYEHMLGLPIDSKNLAGQFQNTRPSILQEEVRALLQFSDVVAISTYPYMVEGLSLTDNYFNPVLSLAQSLQKSIAIDQTAYISRDLFNEQFGITLPGTPASQNAFMHQILNLASRQQFEFIVNFNAIDYGPNFGTDPTSQTWAYAGLIELDGTPKPALRTWQAALGTPYQAHLLATTPRVPHEYFVDIDGDQFGNNAAPIPANSPQIPIGEVIWANDPNDDDNHAIPAVVAKGQRQLSITVDSTTTFDPTWATRVRELGVESVSWNISWQELEEDDGDISLVALQKLRDFDARYGTEFQLDLTITPFVNGVLAVPSDLRASLADGNLRWGNPSLALRFKALLEAIHTAIPHTHLVSLELGRNVDLFFGPRNRTQEIRDFAAFVTQVGSYAKLLWGTSLPVASTLTMDGLVSAADQFAPLVTAGDFVSVSYAAQTNYLAHQPTMVVGELSVLLTRYFDRSIRFQQLEFPSSPYANSSPTKQAQFFHAFFDIWDHFSTTIPFVTLPPLSDARAAHALAVAEANLSDSSPSFPAAVGYQRSLGLWTDVNNSHGEKPAFQSLRQLTSDRGWWRIEPRTVRTVKLGMTPFAYDQVPGGPLQTSVVDTLYRALDTDADLVVYHFDKGVPWVEALADDFHSSSLPYSQNVIDTWTTLKSHQSPRMQVAVAINPLGIPRDRLAPYWGYGEGFYHDADFNAVPTGVFQDYEDRLLPAPWNQLALDSPQVKQAFLNYAKRAIDFFHPNYLVTGIEVNLAQISSPALFSQYVELQEYVYQHLKADPHYSQVQLVVSLTAEHLLRDEFGTAMLYDGIIRPSLIDENIEAVRTLLPFMDVLGLSLYPQKTKYSANSLPPQIFTDLFEQVRSLTDKPLAITESGYGTESFEYKNQPYFTDAQKQDRYLRLLLDESEKDGNVAFITNFSVRDIDGTMDALRTASQQTPPFISPELANVFQFFEHVGLYDYGGNPKPALDTWRRYLSLPQFDTIAVQPLHLSGPNHQVMASLDVEDGTGQLTFSVSRQGQPYLERAVLGITVDGFNLGTGITSISVSAPTEVDESYAVLGGHAQARNHYKSYLVHLSRVGGGASELQLELRVFDDGAAYRWIIPGTGSHTISGEPTGYVLPAGSYVWYQQNTANYESEFRPQLVGTFDNTLGGPVTIELPSHTGYLLITEAALRNYSGMTYRAFAGTPFIIPEFLDDAEWTVGGGSTSPWRVLLTADTLDALANSDIVTNLNPAPDPVLFPNGPQTDYIRPGKSVWSWWSDFTSGASFVQQMQYIDKAHALGFQYSLIDIYWEDGFPTSDKDQFQRLADLNAYAHSDGKNIGLWVWKNWFELKDPFLRRQWLVRVKFAGAVGIKVDNIDASDSESFANVQLMEAILRESAELQLMVDFHGVPKPTGLSRTYPNNIAYEGLMASEINGVLWSQGYFASPRHNAALPFTRFAVGPGDYSPVIFDPRKIGATTVTHQLATAGILISPLLVTADHPDNLLAQTGVRDLLSTLPTVWDETRILTDSKIGSIAAFARRSGTSWYLFVINGDSVVAQNLNDVDLSFLGSQEYDASLVFDGTSTTFDRRELKSLDSQYALDIPLLPGGGFFAKFTPAAVPGRSFRLGFTSVRRTTDEQGFLITYNALQSADLVTHSFQDGVPWLEALNHRQVASFSTALQDRWNLLKYLDEQLLPTHDVYLMLNPLRTSYDQLAPYWGSEENLPLPAPFQPDAINSDLVKQAFTNYVIAAVEFWHPKYLAIGVEANIFLAKRPDLWNAYKDLNAHVYNTVKALYPHLTVLTSVHYEHMLGLQEDSKIFQLAFQDTQPNILQDEVMSLLQHSDLVAWSTYPYASFGNVVGPYYYDAALTIGKQLGKQTAIDQTGYTSQPFTIESLGQSYSGSPEQQTSFLAFLLGLAQQEHFAFVNHFVSVDYGTNYGTGVNLTWAYTGLLDLNLNPKPALQLWQSFVAAPYTGEYPHQMGPDTDSDGVPDREDAAPFDVQLSTRQLYYRDQDGDGEGTTHLFIGAPSLEAPPGYVPYAGDPNDQDFFTKYTPLPWNQRRLGLELIESSELGSFAENLNYASSLGASVSSLHLDWAWIEPTPGHYIDPNQGGSGVSRAPSLQEINTRFPAHGLGLSLTLRPINAQTISVPSDLAGMRFNSPQLIQRFRSMLDFVMQQLPDVEIFSLQIGNEIDFRLSNDPQLASDYADFLQQIRTYIQTPHAQGGAGYYGHAPFPVGTTATLFGLLNPATAGMLAAINAHADVINVTYYPTVEGFVQKDPFFITQDIAQLVASYPGRKIYFQETGYASAPLADSSLLKQSQYISAFTQIWDTFAEQIPYAQFLKLYDSSPEIANSLAASPPYSTVSPVLSSFLRTLGFRTYNGIGENKPALGLLNFEFARRRGTVADLNGDGSVDAADAGIMFAQWGDMGRASGDLNLDQIVDAADAGELFAAWTGDTMPLPLEVLTSNQGMKPGVIEGLFTDVDFLDILEGRDAEFRAMPPKTRARGYSP